MLDENLKTVGELQITEKGMKRMDKDGNIAQDSWFEFKGLGFDSEKYGARISFFASTITDSDSEESSVAPSAVEAAQAAETESEETQVYHESQTEVETEEEKIETEKETENETETSVMTFGF